MGERFFHLQMGGEYDADHLQQRPLSLHNREWRNVKMSRTMMLYLLMMALEDAIRFANASMRHSNVAGQDLKRKNG